MSASRTAALGLALLGGAALVLARSFTVAFPTDPLGPRAFPWFAAGLLVCFGVWAAAGREVGQPAARSAGARRAWLALLSFLLFAVSLEPLGFVLATTVEFAVLSRMFGGRWGPGLAAGALFAVGLFFVFVQGLGLPLPTGAWLPGGG